MAILITIIISIFAISLAIVIAVKCESKAIELEGVAIELENSRNAYKQLYENEKKYTNRLKEQMEDALSRIEEFKKKDVKKSNKRQTKAKTEEVKPARRRKTTKEDK